MTPPQPYTRDLLRYLARGQVAEAEHLLAMLNRIQKAFGHPDYEMPVPFSLTEARSDPFLPKEWAA